MSKKDNEKQTENLSEGGVSEVPSPSIVEDAISKEDFLELRLSVSELEVKQLQLKNIKQQALMGQSQLEDAQKNFESVRNEVGKKYGLDLDKDQITLPAGTITRG